MTRGREAVREHIIGLAGIQPRHSVLDVGCGTGTLAIAASRHVGGDGSVYGLDPSREMIARAERKAARARVAVVFTRAAAEQLPFEDGRFVRHYLLSAAVVILVLAHLGVLAAVLAWARARRRRRFRR